MKTPSERGPFGAWLVEQRNILSAKRGRKVLQRDVVRELAELGYPIDETYYRGIEGGSKMPGRELRERLAAFGGVPPAPRSPSTDIGQLVVALREQTSAINGLAQRLELTAATQQGQTDGLLQAVAELVTLLRPQAERVGSQR